MPTKSAISFGLVHIPISLHTATTDNDVHFNQLRGGMRQPVFKGLRDDKTPEECVAW